MLLNRANRVLGIYEASTGGVAGTVAEPKLIFLAAMKACASSFVLCHNHPSGNLKPSAADLQLTKMVKAGASCSTSRSWTTSSSPAGVTTPWRTSPSPTVLLLPVSGGSLLIPPVRTLVS